MELSNLQGQLKVAIQKHQIIVGKMKSDEQNASLQKQLRELQAEIISLSEKQKHVVENLRKERDANQNKVLLQQQITKQTKVITATTLSNLSTNTVNVIPSNARFIISTTESKSRQISVNTGVQSHGLSFRVEKPVIKSGNVPPVPTAAQKIIHQVVPSIVSNLVANANSNSLNATVLFPSLSASQTSAIINASNRMINPKSGSVTTPNSSLVLSATSNSSPLSSVLVVPSPISSCRPSSDSQTSNTSKQTNLTNPTSTTTTSSASFILKLGSPIRVPQYPPPNSRATTVTSTVDSCGTVVTAFENGPVVKKEKKIPQPLLLPATDVKSIDVKPVKLKAEKIEDSNKMNFMTALGLINREVMNELQSKRGERKRRTTANPQFSNAAIEEKKRNAAALLSAAAANPLLKMKKPRGRQKLNVTPIQSPIPTPPPSTPSTTSIVTTTTNSRIENGANIFISRNGTNLVITNTTTQCNSLDNLPLGAHHVRVKTEPLPSHSSTSFKGSVSLNDDCVPLNCSKKSVTPSAVMAVNKNALNNNKIMNSLINKSSADNGSILTTKVDSLIKPIPKNNILNGCLKTVLNKNGGILSDVILCGICHLRLGAGSGDMLACFGCKRPYHTRCAAKVVPQLNDGKIVNKNAHWKCPKCVIPISSSTVSSLAASSSLPSSVTLTVPAKALFTHHQPWKKDTPTSIPIRTEKQVKEEEKQRHLKRSKELNEEMTRLKDKRQRLADVQAASLKRQAELVAAKKSTEEALNKMHETVNMVRNRIS